MVYSPTDRVRTGEAGILNASVTTLDKYPHKCLYCDGTEPRLGPFHMGRPFKVLVPMRGEVQFTPYTCQHCLRAHCEATGLADAYRFQGHLQAIEERPEPDVVEPKPWAESTVDELAAAVVKHLEVHRREEIAAGIEAPDVAPPKRRTRKPKEAA